MIKSMLQIRFFVMCCNPHSYLDKLWLFLLCVVIIGVLFVSLLVLTISFTVVEDYSKVNCFLVFVQHVNEHNRVPLTEIVSCFCRLEYLRLKWPNG